jgi:hypothetical protein
MIAIIRGLTVAVIVAALLPLTGPAAEAADKRTHILAIAACPPRPPLIGMRSTKACERILPKVSAGLATRLGAAPGDIHQLLNAEATAPAVLAQLRDISSHLGANDRLVIYMVSHGGAITRDARQEEIFMLWTTTKPAFLQLGIATGVYLPARDLAAAIHATGAGEVVVLLDSCEAGLADPDFIARHPDNKPERPEAVVTSTHGAQFAMMDVDFTPLFSSRLLDALERAHPTLADVVADAADGTRRDAPAICREMARRFAAKGTAVNCEQDPAFDDPSKLLTRIALRPVQRIGTE